MFHITVGNSACAKKKKDYLKRVALIVVLSSHWRCVESTLHRQYRQHFSARV